MYQVKKIVREARRSNRTGSPVVTQVRWTVVDENGVQRDVEFIDRKRVERIVERLNGAK